MSSLAMEKPPKHVKLVPRSPNMSDIPDLSATRKPVRLPSRRPTTRQSKRPTLAPRPSLFRRRPARVLLLSSTSGELSAWAESYSGVPAAATRPSEEMAASTEFTLSGPRNRPCRSGIPAVCGAYPTGISPRMAGPGAPTCRLQRGRWSFVRASDGHDATCSGTAADLV